MNSCVLDRLINKPVQVTFPDDKQFSHNDRIVYKDSEGKEFLGQYLGYSLKTSKKGSFVRALAGKELERFEGNKEKASRLFKDFDSQFSKEFPKSKPLTARMNLYGSQIYFYFFAEDRYDFSSFVKNFREQIDIKFFIYQVSARDRIRLFPNLDERYDANGLPLMYSIFKHPLDQVDNDAIEDQGLRGRDVERLKDRSGKLDHTLNFEADIYATEIPKYPEKRSILTYDDKKMKCIGYNILTQQIQLRGEDSEKPGEFYGEFLTVSLEEFEKLGKIKKKKPKKAVFKPRKDINSKPKEEKELAH